MTFRFCAAAVLLTALGAGAAGGASAEPLRIVCIGDSITQGGKAGRAERSYRVPLYHLLKAEGLEVDFVGSRQAGLDPQAVWPSGFDTDHEGYYGAKTAQVRDALRTAMPRFPAADVALIDLGTNDQGSDTASTVTPALMDIIEMLRQRNPQVRIYLAEIPIRWRNWRTRWQIRALARSESTPESQVVTVDQHSGWNVGTDTFDGIHPNPKGQLKMARRWFETMRPALGVEAE